MILDKIKTVTNKPVIMVLNSHGHSDHAGSNVELPPPPAVEYIVHENIVKMWSQDTCTNVGNCEQVQGRERQVPARNAPSRTSSRFSTARIASTCTGSAAGIRTATRGS